LKNLFEVNFHLGKESEKFLREFESKRADCSIREIAVLPVEDLKVLCQSFGKEVCTFEAPEKIAV